MSVAQLLVRYSAFHYEEAQMTTTAVDDRTAIGDAVQLYIDGASKGDTAKLEAAFHSDARMFGAIDGQRFDMPIGQMFEVVSAQPLDSDGSFRARITSVEQAGDAAVVTLEEEGCWGDISFVDFFSLARIDGEWKIVNKTFTHTGGHLPQSP